MPRVLSLPEQKWHQLADELATKGSAPTVRGLAALAKERFGLGASFTTIQALLDSWRRLGGQNRPKSANASFTSLIQRTVEPLYEQMLEDAAGKYEPLLIEAESRVNEISAKCEQLTSQLATRMSELKALRDERSSLLPEMAKLRGDESSLRMQIEELRRENSHLRAEASATEKRWMQARTDLLARVQALEAHNALLLQSRHEDNERYNHIITSIQQMREPS